MHSQLVVVLLVGLAISAYGLDLSHATKRSAEEERRLFQFAHDFYSEVVYRPLNHIVTNMALLGAQVLAGISQTGLPNPNGRTDYPSEAQLRTFWDKLWQQGLKPQIENTLSAASLSLAQVLANIGTNGINLSIGRSEAEMRGWLDDLGNAAVNVVKGPVETALQNGALMVAQVLAGIGVNGINLSSLFSGLGKRDLTEAEMRGFLDFISNALSSVYEQVIKDPLEGALQNGALMAAQVLAGIGVNGINLSELVGGIGKRDLNDVAARQAELRGLFDVFGQTVLNGLQSVWTNVVKGPVEQAAQTTALLGAQVLAGIGVNGINLSELFGSIGKRDLTDEARGELLNSLLSHAGDLYQQQLKPVIESGLSNAVLHLAGVLANFGMGRR